MAGHGSDPAMDRGDHPNRKVGRTTGAPSGVVREPIFRPLSKYFSPHEIEEYKA